MYKNVNRYINICKTNLTEGKYVKSQNENLKYINSIPN